MDADWLTITCKNKRCKTRCGITRENFFAYGKNIVCPKCGVVNGSSDKWMRVFWNCENCNTNTSAEFRYFRKNSVHCGACRQKLQKEKLNQQMQDSSSQLFANKGQLTVSELDKNNMTITISNECEVERHCTIIAVPDRDHFTWQFLRPPPFRRGKFVFEPYTHYKMKIEANSSYSVNAKDLLLFKLDGFMIGRWVRIVSVNNSEIEYLKPKEKYIPIPRNKLISNPDNYEIDCTASPPTFSTTYNPIKRISHFPVPQNLGAIWAATVELTRLDQTKYIEAKCRNLLQNQFSKCYWHTLLHLEELQLVEDLKMYTLEKTTLACDTLSGGYWIDVPGLAEKRPSVLRGDKVRVFSSKGYEGYVYKVEANRIRAHFGSKFSKDFINGKFYRVEFCLPRIVFNRMHHSIEHPSPSVFIHPNQIPPMRFQHNADCLPFNKNINKEQLQAVTNIVKNTHGLVPYIIFGPPGTGKTMTVVETIKQILYHRDDARILVTAPSNNAADIFIDRLRGHVEKRRMIRLNAAQRNIDDCPPSVSEHSFWNSNAEAFAIPSNIKEYQVIVSTCMSASLLYEVGLEHHFTHIFIDEAAQAMEPESLIPLMLAGPLTQVVLAGDHKQLGPIVHCSVAINHHLDQSILERLIQLNQYKLLPSGGLDPNFATKLVQNYRSHPAILKLPSLMFYDDELIPKADTMIVESMLRWEKLPNKRIPMMFIGVEGKEQREGKSPSWYNSVEILEVVKIIKSLLEYKYHKVRVGDIGVITPYIRQVQKIRDYLKDRSKLPDAEKIQVGSVESFQGLEKRIIIISCVRSNSDFVEFDYRHRIGFLKNPKRFNVAITRPQALLVVIGNPRILKQDKCWEGMLMYCLTNKLYTGIPFNLDEQESEWDKFLQQEKSIKGFSQHEVDIEITNTEKNFGIEL